MPIKAASTRQRGVDLVRTVAGPTTTTPFRPSAPSLKRRIDDLGAVMRVVVAEFFTITYRVDLVEEHDRRRLRTRVIKGRAHGLQHIPRGAPSPAIDDRSEDKMHVARPRQRLREGGLANARRAADQGAALPVPPSGLEVEMTRTYRTQATRQLLHLETHSFYAETEYNR